MNGYFYHGIEFYPGCVGSAIQKMIKILNEGLIFRNQARGYADEKFNHICLYKKSDDYEYGDNLHMINSARGGWIDGQFVFIISPDIIARKAELGSETNLVDEWRCYENISPTSFVGIALPHKAIQDYINEEVSYYDAEGKKDKEIARQYLPILLEQARSMGLSIVDSDEENFTDKMDKNLNNRVLK